MALGLESLDDFTFAIGQHAGLELLDAESLRDRASRGGMISGQHHDAEAFVREVRQRLWRGLLDGVGNREQTRNLAPDRDEDHGRALCAESLGRAGEITRRHFLLAHQALVA